MAPITLSQRVRTIIGDSFGAAIVEQRLEKAIQDAKERASEPQSQFYDPLSLFLGREWLDRQDRTLNFLDLRRMAQNPIIGSIIQTRVNQVAAFCQPQPSAYDYGFKLVRDDQTSEESDSDALKKELTQWIYQCGIPGYGEDSLESFARKFMRDSLVLDQACAEIVPRRNGLPAYTVVVDGATIRKLKESLEYATPANNRDPLYVQVINDTVQARYTADQMIFGVRNPQSDMRYAGYGMPELEMLIRVVLAIVNTERYNASQIAQGGTSRGILLVKGNADKVQFESFKRDFREAIRTAGSYWRPPVLQVDKDANVEWKELDRSAKDMEYAALFDFLVKQACALFQMDPSEINWEIGAHGVTTQFNSQAKEKALTSQQRGLRPLLNFLANNLNRSIISKYDPKLRLEFVGLNMDRAQDAEVRTKEVTNFKTLNEVRKELNLEPLPGGDIPLNAIYAQAIGIGQGDGSGDSSNLDPKEFSGDFPAEDGVNLDELTPTQEEQLTD